MPYTLSPSSLALFKQCPHCFWLSIKKNISRPAAIYPSLPYGIDKVLKERFDFFRSQNKLPLELRSLGSEFFLCEHPLLTLWKDNRQGLRWIDPQGNMLLGAVDDILQQGNKLIILEYVTRGFELKEDTVSYYQDQVNLYTYLLRKNGFETENYAYVLFYYPKGVNWRGDVWFHKKLEKVPVSLEAAEKLFHQALEILNQDLPLSSKECEFCRWKTR